MYIVKYAIHGSYGLPFLFKLHLSVFLLKMSHMDGRMEDFKKKELKELESLGDTEIDEWCCLVGF